LTCSDINRENAPACTCKTGFINVGERIDCLAEYRNCAKTATAISYGGYEGDLTNSGIYLNEMR